jgi:hypothetical protein
MLLHRSLILGALVMLPKFSPVSNTAVWPEAAMRVHTHRHGPIRLKAVNPDGTATSSNWSGFAIDAATDSVTVAKASWLVPTVKCNNPSTGYSSFWVGIDGDSTTAKTADQTGTEADCSSGRANYFAWYEFYPKFPVTLFAVTAGARITASVTYSGGKFTTHIEDDHGHSSTHTSSVTGAQRNSAEWIVEAPYSGGVLPLADFGTGYFGDNHTGVGATCEAKIGGKTHPISGFAHTKIDMADPHGQSADPSGLSSDGTSFSVTWH